MKSVVAMTQAAVVVKAHKKDRKAMGRVSRRE